MKSKRLLQIFILLALVFSSFGNSQHVSAGSVSASPLADALIINRDLNIWDATYIGFVSASIYEKWHLDLTEAHNFVVSISTVTGDLVPLLILQDVNGNEIARGTGTLTTTQPAGNYYIQTQPESGSGFYILTLRQIVNLQPSVSTSVNPTSLNVGESAVVTVNLNNVPADGYTSAEFTCTYDATLLTAGNIIVAPLFGADAAVAINGPQNGSFIVAIAGSNGSKATTSGTVFTFSVTGLQVGQASVECKARVSRGDSLLTDLPSTAASLTVVGIVPTTTPIESPTPVETLTPIDTVTPAGTLTPVETVTPAGTSTPVQTATPTFTATPIESPTPTPLPDGTLGGQVLASKPVTVSLYKADSTLAASVTANADGTFTLQAPVGTYTVIATASGFLSAQGSVTIGSGALSTLPVVSLLAGDIDNNNVIDQFDALTVGMSYNTATPAAADLNNDGVINVLDLELLARNYRDTGPVVWQ